MAKETWEVLQSKMLTRSGEIISRRKEVGRRHRCIVVLMYQHRTFDFERLCEKDVNWRQNEGYLKMGQDIN